jgi:hypothetical protein
MIYVGRVLKGTLRHGSPVFLCALFHDASRWVQEFHTGLIVPNYPEYLVPIAVGYIKRPPKLQVTPTLRSRRRRIRCKLEGVDQKFGGHVGDLKSVDTTLRMKIRGRHCSIAQVLGTYALCK